MASDPDSALAHNDSGALETRRRTDLRRAQVVAKWTDQRFLDPLVGLVLPGVGDVLGAAAGLYIVALAVRHRAPRSLVARMLVNLSVDCLGGVVPLVGDLFDALNRANQRNVRLLRQHLEGAGEAPRLSGVDREASSSSGRSGSLAAAVALLVAAVAVAAGAAYEMARHWGT